MLKKINQYYVKFNEWLLVFLFLLTLTLSVAAIMGRWLGHSLSFAEPISRHLILFLAFVGGVSAIDKKVHIKIDLFSSLFEKKIPAKLANIIAIFIFFSSIIVTALLLQSSYHFFQIENEFGTIGLLGFHSSTFVSVIFIGFFLILIKFILSLLLALTGSENE